jgi:hypothetical protein
MSVFHIAWTDNEKKYQCAKVKAGWIDYIPNTIIERADLIVKNPCMQLVLKDRHGLMYPAELITIPELAARMGVALPLEC